MKNLKSFLLCLIVLLLGVIAFYLLSPNFHPEKWMYKGEPADTTAVVNAEKTFSSVEEVIIFHKQQAEKKELDTQFLSMSDKVLTCVTTVLLNKKEPVTVKSIVQEYLANKIIYDSLSPKGNQPTQGLSNDTLNGGLSIDTLVDSVGNKKIIFYKK